MTIDWVNGDVENAQNFSGQRFERLDTMTHDTMPDVPEEWDE